ncbi:gluconate 2-dehydrogenase subunit 3 family protein [Olivibacter ginsenosidimutans]|uniref:Gluconate 2-dehydrogenase subunit 3 family protein n=1 Tax=Olivibacter ginsenosidimutans TaxID=1176537 RepID=A0ABP9C615_9SPHI
MKRRAVIKNLLIVAGGVAVLPSCTTNSGKASIQLNRITIDSDQEQILSEITETLIPRTDGPGAKDLNLHLFVLKMVDDCHSKDDQTCFINGLNIVEDLAQKRFNQSVKDITAAQRLTLLQELENTENKDQDSYRFYTITKRRTIQGFLNSKYVMSDLKRYELIPGRYNGYFPVKSSSKTS